MRRNRNYRKRARSGRAPGVLWLTVFTAAAMGFAWLWLTNRCEALATRIRELEQQKLALRRQVAAEEFKWSTLTTYENMMKLLRQHGIEMDWPSERQIVRVRRSGAGSTQMARK